MADDKAAPPEPGAATEEVPSGPKLIMGMPLPIFAVIALNVLVMLGGMGFIVWIKLMYKSPVITNTQAVEEITKKVEKKVSHESSEEGDGSNIQTFPEMTVLLKTASGGKNHYATLEFALECNNAGCLDEIKNYKEKIEDTMQSYVGAKSFTELNAIETRFRLKHEILKQINSFLKEGNVVTSLYFSNFLTQ